MSMSDDFDYDLIIVGCGVGGHGAALHARSCGRTTKTTFTFTFIIAHFCLECYRRSIRRSNGGGIGDGNGSVIV